MKVISERITSIVIQLDEPTYFKDMLGRELYVTEYRFMVQDQPVQSDITGSATGWKVTKGGNRSLQRGAIGHLVWHELPKVIQDQVMAGGVRN